MLKRYRSMSVIAKAAFWALFANILQKGIGILATPVFTRILTAEEFAQYTLYQSWHDIFIIFATLNVLTMLFTRQWLNLRMIEADLLLPHRLLQPAYRCYVLWFILSYRCSAAIFWDFHCRLLL